MATRDVSAEGIDGEPSGGRDPVRCGHRCMRQQRPVAESREFVAGDAAVAVADDPGSATRHH